MPTYDFEDATTGEPVQVYIESMADAPDIGKVIQVEGRSLKRVWRPEESRVQVSVPRDVRFVSQSLPPVVDSDGKPTGHWDPETKYVKDRRSTDYGQPYVESKRDITALEKGSDGEFRYRRD